MNKLREYRKACGATQADLAKYLGVAQSAISLYEKGTRDPDIPTLRKLAKYFGVSVDDLIGEGGIPSAHILNVSDPMPLNTLQIPLLGYIGASDPDLLADINDGETVDAPTWCDDVDGLFALTVRGDSMSPVILDRATVIIDTNGEARNGSIVAYSVNGDSGAVKYFMRHPDGVSLIPANPAYGALSFSNGECERLPVRIIGVVIEIRNPAVVNPSADLEYLRRRIEE